MITVKPLVSIGLPVFNGEHFLRQALDSLLAQDYQNFEINISDNASTDDTNNICLEYAAKDPRIRYHRSPSNMGVCVNFDRTLKLSSGKYFMWAADHDLWHPTFISQCVSLLEQDQQVVIAYPQGELIDLDGAVISRITEKVETRGMSSALKRYKCLIWNIALCNMIYGLFRRDVLNQVGAFKEIYGADYLLLAKILMRGQSAHIAEPLFFLRKNRPEEWTNEEQYKQRLQSYLNPTKATENSKKSMNQLYLEMVYAFLQMLVYAPLSVTEKFEAAKETIYCFEKRFNIQLPRSLVLLKKLYKASPFYMPPYSRKSEQYQ